MTQAHELGLGFSLPAALPDEPPTRYSRVVAIRGRELDLPDGTLYLPVPPDDGESPWENFIRVGETAILYGRSTIRGLFVFDSTTARLARIYYRTEEEDQRIQDLLTYGADARDLLARWERGDIVHSVEMGGLGPGYEQAIQAVSFRLLHHLLTAVDPRYDASDWRPHVNGSEVASARWRRDLDRIWAWADGDEQINALGLSGAQWGAAVNLATRFFADDDPSKTIKSAPEDRRILVSKHFPGTPRASEVAQ